MFLNLKNFFPNPENWDGSGGISEFRLGNPPPLLVAPLHASLESKTRSK